MNEPQAWAAYLAASRDAAQRAVIIATTVEARPDELVPPDLISKYVLARNAEYEARAVWQQHFDLR